MFSAKELLLGHQLVWFTGWQVGCSLGGRWWWSRELLLLLWERIQFRMDNLCGTYSQELLQKQQQQLACTILIHNLSVHGLLIREVRVRKEGAWRVHTFSVVVALIRWWWERRCEVGNRNWLMGLRVGGLWTKWTDRINGSTASHSLRNKKIVPQFRLGRQIEEGIF